jgi:uncharacterized integral membrane protein (TIGR00697 family)
MCVILANIQVMKLITLFGMTATLGNILYGTSFLATDILSENYGKKDANLAVHIGFFMLLMMVVVMKFAILFIPNPHDMAHEALSKIFGLTPRVAGASFCAYACSQYHDVWMFHLLKDKTHDKHLWLRNNVSTMVSQAIDTGIFVGVAFYGMYPTNVLLSLFLSTYVIKWIVALSDTWCVYLARKWFREGKIRTEAEYIVR